MTTIDMHHSRIERDAYIAGRNLTINQGEQAYLTEGLRSPYLGLKSFEYDDHARYAGRDTVIDEALAALTSPGAERSLLFIIGASGSGKSSLAMAGIAPALYRHYKKRGTKARYAPCRPLLHPLADLMDALKSLGLVREDERHDPLDLIGTPEAFAACLAERTPSGQINLLVFDQFEELLVRSDSDTNAKQRSALLDILANLPAFSVGHTHIIATMRSEYMQELRNRPSLADAVKQGIDLDLRPMSVQELKAAIQRPLQSKRSYKHKHWDKALVSRLAEQAAQDVTYLPLLQVTLANIWDSGRLMLSSYGTADQEGSLTDAIEQHAEKVYQQPRSADAQRMIMDIFLELVEPLDDGLSHVVRRRRIRRVVATSHERNRLIDDLATARLLSTSNEAQGDQREASVSIIHESLIHNWDRLGQAIFEKSGELQQRVRFERAVRLWEEKGRAVDSLLTGMHLDEARTLADRQDVAVRDVAGPGRMLLERSIAAENERRERELKQAHELVKQTEELVKVRTKAATRNRRWATGLAFVSVLAIALGGFAWYQRGEAIDAAAQAKSRQLAAQCLTQLDQQYDLALLLCAQAVREAPTVEARRSLLSTLTYKTHLVRYVARGVSKMAESPSGPYGSWLATVDNHGLAVRQVNGAGTFGAPIALDTSSRDTSPHSLFFTNRTIAFSHDGQLLAEQRGDGKIMLWRTSTDRPKFLIALRGCGELTVALVSWLAFGPHNGSLIEVDANGALWLHDFTSRNVDCKELDPGFPLSNYLQLLYRHHVSVQQSVTFLEKLRSHANVCGSMMTPHLAISTDGRWLACAGSSFYVPSPVGHPRIDSVLYVWDLQSHRLQRIEHRFTEQGAVSNVGFTLDGQVAVALSDDSILLQNLKTGRATKQWLAGHSLTDSDLSFVGDYYVAADSTPTGSQGQYDLRLWDAGDWRADSLSNVISLSSQLVDVVSSADSSLLTLDGKGNLMQWNMYGGPPWESRLDLFSRYDRYGIPLPGGDVNGLAVSSDGRLLAAAAGDAGVDYWRMLYDGSYGLANRLPQDKWEASGVAISPGGRWLAAVGGDDSVELWDMQHQQPKRAYTLRTGNSVAARYILGGRGIAFSPNGRWLAACRVNGTVDLWDMQATLPRLQYQLKSDQPFEPSASNSNMAFSKSSELLAVANPSETRVWDLQGGRPIAIPGLAGMGANAVAFSSDDHWLAIAQSGEVDLVSILNAISQADLAQHFGARPTQSIQLNAPGNIDSVTFSHDSNLLAAGNDSGDIYLWSTSDDEPLGTLTTAISSPYVPIYGPQAIAFSPQSEQLITGQSDYLSLIDLSDNSLIDDACFMANRNLSSSEWQTYMGTGSSPKQTCVVRT